MAHLFFLQTLLCWSDYLRGFLGRVPSRGKSLNSITSSSSMGKKLAPSVSLEQGEQQDRETQLNHEMRLMVEERRIYQLEVRFDSLTVDLVGNIYCGAQCPEYGAWSQYECSHKQSMFAETRTGDSFVGFFASDLSLGLFLNFCCCIIFLVN